MVRWCHMWCCYGLMVLWCDEMAAWRETMMVYRQGGVMVLCWDGFMVSNHDGLKTWWRKGILDSLFDDVVLWWLKVILFDGVLVFSFVMAWWCHSAIVWFRRAVMVLWCLSVRAWLGQVLTVWPIVKFLASIACASLCTPTNGDSACFSVNISVQQMQVQGR